MSGITRRTFLRAGVALPLAGAAVPVFSNVAFARFRAADRVLVLIRLDGGNDGLNTIVPFEDDLYYRARPGIGIEASSVIGLDAGVGMNPAMEALRPLWDQGRLAVIQGVGYPNASRSHFEASDIWHTASLERPERWTGWLGRALDRGLSGGALQVAGGELNLSLVAERTVVPAVADASTFQVKGDAGTIDRLAQLATPDRPEMADDLAFLSGAAEKAYGTARDLERALGGGRGRDSYPESELARSLWQVARLIEAELPMRVYALALGGFDTHSRQRPGHDTLLRTLAEALAAFHGDLEKIGAGKRVLSLTYSEFGRRVAENRSLGTDHGAAAPLLAVGRGVRGGVHGAHPSLSELEQGDTVFHTDFRGVYATVLDRWLDVDARTVLGGDFGRVRFL